MPQSGNPVSDKFLDGLKKLASRAQVEGQPGHPISEAIVEITKLLAKTHTKAQLESEKKDGPQSGSPISDAIINSVKATHSKA